MSPFFVIGNDNPYNYILQLGEYFDMLTRFQAIDIR